MNALQFVREAKYLSYKTLKEENDRMSKIIQSIMSTARGSVSFTHAEYTNTTNNPHINGSTYFWKYSQAEHTITQHKGYSSADTKLYHKSGIKYPSDNIINFVSNFPYGFRGCFVFWKRISLL